MSNSVCVGFPMVAHVVEIVRLRRKKANVGMGCSKYGSLASVALIRQGAVFRRFLNKN